MDAPADHPDAAGRGLEESNELAAALRIRLARGIGSTLSGRLLRTFGAPTRVLRAGRGELTRVRGVGAAHHRALGAPALDRAVAEEQEWLGHLGARVHWLGSPGYPAPLAQLPDPPGLIWIRGELVPEDQVAVAIVGTRACTEYGRRTAYRLAFDLARSGFTIVSGLARGIDGAAHQGALDAGGRTIGVCGCGLAVRYPAANADLLESIPDRGALLCELPCRFPPRPQNFPARNRLLCALALAVIIVEAPRGSGALITADLALDQGREVLAVPGPIDQPASAGTNSLIQAGAGVVTSADDVISELAPRLHALGAAPASASPAPTTARPAPRLQPEEASLVELVRRCQGGLSEIVERSGLEPAELQTRLLDLELRGIIEKLPGNRFRVLIPEQPGRA
jgi:DNA processing protein